MDIVTGLLILIPTFFVIYLAYKKKFFGYYNPYDSIMSGVKIFIVCFLVVMSIYGGIYWLIVEGPFILLIIVDIVLVLIAFAKFNSKTVRNIVLILAIGLVTIRGIHEVQLKIAKNKFDKYKLDQEERNKGNENNTSENEKQEAKANKPKESNNSPVIEETIESLNFSSALASSELAPDSSNSYEPSLVLDNNDATTWAEGASGSGNDAWIQVNFDGDEIINKLYITNGFAKSEDWYLKNNRIKKARLDFSDNSSMIVNFEDNKLTPQVINLGKEGKKTSYVKLTILDTYKGTKYDDTCISSIKAEGKKISGNTSTSNNKSQLTRDEALTKLKNFFQSEDISYEIRYEYVGQQSVQGVPYYKFNRYTKSANKEILIGTYLVNDENGEILDSKTGKIPEMM